MAISSPGVGSGLDVNSIVTQLGAIERQPLKNLQTRAATFQSQLSLYGTIKSQMATLSDAATALATADKWTAQKATSSNAAAAAVTASTTATATSFGLDITQLARAQTTASMNVTAATTTTPAATLGVAGQSGTLTINLGSWATGSFVPGTSSVGVAINGDDNLTAIAAKINAANAGISATVLRSGTQERLSFQSSTTGEANGFKIESDAGFAGLAALSFTSQAATATASGMQSSQTGLNAAAKINGVDIDSATNILTDVVPGLTISLAQVTTVGSPVQITVAQDKEAMQKSVQALADAYTAVNKTIADATRYVSGGESGALQGDSTTIGLQSLMRSIIGSSSSGSSFSRLSQIGLEQQTDGSLKVNDAKLTTALADVGNLQKFFTTDNSSTTTNGFGLKLRDFAKGLIAFDGRVTNKATALQGSINRNSVDQDRVNERAARVETQLRRQYSALRPNGTDEWAEFLYYGATCAVEQAKLNRRFGSTASKAIVMRG